MKMLIGQEGIRQCLIQYCNQKGVKYCYIAEKIGVHFSTISHFINNRDMRTNSFNKLVNYLDSVDYLDTFINKNGK